MSSSVATGRSAWMIIHRIPSPAACWAAVAAAPLRPPPSRGSSRSTPRSFSFAHAATPSSDVTTTTSAPASTASAAVRAPIARPTSDRVAGPSTGERRAFATPKGLIGSAARIIATFRIRLDRWARCPRDRHVRRQPLRAVGRSSPLRIPAPAARPIGAAPPCGGIVRRDRQDSTAGSRLGYTVPRLGVIVEEGSPDELLQNPKHERTRRFLRAVKHK